MTDVQALIGTARHGGVRAIARLLTMVENGGEAAAAVSGRLLGLPRSGHVVGITGAPGAGKSTLTGALLKVFRTGPKPLRVAVLAVDPSSPFTGGALLGDRVRMADWATDPGVYIRSLASRGHLGGLSAGAPAAIDLLCALGFDLVIVETVGVGQSEVEVMDLVDTVAVVLAPGMGDEVQAAKAGIMEIADVLVVNKSDHDGARNTVRELRAMLLLAHGDEPVGHSAWSIPIVSTMAEAGTGVADLADALRRHHEYLTASGEITTRRARRASADIAATVLARLRRSLGGQAGREQIGEAASRVIRGEIDTHAAADRILAWLAAGSALPTAR